ncbi:MAG: Cationic amino acid transporter 2 [Geoglossum simile]|nr:MAG: Cationic amino acid transporter 2 [Geoglossum simile]
MSNRRRRSSDAEEAAPDDIPLRDINGIQGEHRHIDVIDGERGADGVRSGRKPFAAVANKNFLLFRKLSLDRALERPQIAGIAFSGSVGIGFFISSGELIGISGSLGSVISFICAGLVVIAVMRTLAEMASVRPLSGALIDYPHTFVDPALGFAVGCLFCLAQCICMATLTAAAARIADSFSDKFLSSNKRIFIILGLYSITLGSNICGVKIYGEIERVVKFFKMCLFILLILLMILVKAGVGRRPLGSSDHPMARDENGFGNNSLVPSWQWAGFANGSHGDGISGTRGQFLAIWTCITLAMFACTGGDIVIVTSGESKYPRRDLPPVARFMYLAPIGLYVITALLVGMNINYMNPDLYHPWEKPVPGLPPISQSPFIIVLKNTTIAVLPKFINACFLISAYTAGNTCLFVSSRTLFAVAQTYGNDFFRDTLALGRTNDGNTPLPAIFACSLFGLLAFLGLADVSFNEPVLALGSFFTGSIACVYGSECIAFLRFLAGLKELERRGTLSRDSDEYKENHYRAHWQPLFAIFGLIACTLIVAFSGWPAIYLLSEKRKLASASQLKSNIMLVADVIGAYSGPLIFLTLYFGYKAIHSTSFRQIRDYEGEYTIPEFDADQPLKRGYSGSSWAFLY